MGYQKPEEVAVRRVSVGASKAKWIAAAVTAGRGGGTGRAGLQSRGTTLNHSDCLG